MTQQEMNDFITFVIITCVALGFVIMILASLMIEQEQDEERPDVIVWDSSTL